MASSTGEFCIIPQQKAESICFKLWDVIASHLRIFIVASFKFCSQKFCVFVNMSARRRMYTAGEAVAMLEDASECDLALSDLDVQVIFTLKSIVNLSVRAKI